MRAFHAGIAWTFTDKARELLLDLVAEGLEYDLAVELLHKQVESGYYAEQEIYDLPDEELEIEL